jgi:hypothetical protein
MNPRFYGVSSAVFLIFKNERRKKKGGFHGGFA